MRAYDMDCGISMTPTVMPATTSARRVSHRVLGSQVMAGTADLVSAHAAPQSTPALLRPAGNQWLGRSTSTQRICASFSRSWCQCVAMFWESDTLICGSSTSPTANPSLPWNDSSLSIRCPLPRLRDDDATLGVCI